MKLSVIIPAHNECENIKETLDELTQILQSIPEVSDYQVIVVDDHSSDDTYEIIEQLNDSRLGCLRLSKRSGSHTALRAGLNFVQGDAALCISADGQDNPNYLNEMLEKWKNGAKIIWGLRKSRHTEPWYVKLPAAVFYAILNRLGNYHKGNIDLSKADFYLLDRSVVEAVNSYSETRTSLFGLINWVGFQHDYVYYERRERKHGTSKWNLSSRLTLARDWIVAFSGVPLKMVSLVGFFVAILGFLYAIIVVVNVVIGKPVEGWSSMIILILILGGTQMIMLGVLGEYLWQNLEESRRRPLYFVEKKTQDVG